MRLIGSAFLLILSLGFVSGCKKREVVLAPQIAGLIGTWRLVEPDSTYAVTLVFALDTANPPLDITPFLASGKSSVNEYTVRLFATIDGTMSSENLSSTYKSGSLEATKFEQRYFNNLKAVVRYELLSPTRLRLRHGNEQPYVMVYEKIN